jgi:nitrogen fixation protein NifU and related proteins
VTVFDDALLELARPRSRAVIGAPTVVGHASNPLCGDDIEVSARVVDGVILAAAYRSHACALTSASASVLADLVPGRPVGSAKDMGGALAAALADRAGAMPAGFEVLAAARLLPSRRRCVLLPWEALKVALATV